MHISWWSEACLVQNRFPPRAQIMRMRVMVETRPVFGSAACSQSLPAVNLNNFLRPHHYSSHSCSPPRPSLKRGGYCECTIGRNSRYQLCHKTFPTQSNVHTQLSATIITIIYTIFIFLLLFHYVLLLCITTTPYFCCHRAYAIY